MRVVSTYLIGLLFGLGIMISGMANPAKVINFFDVAGSWDPSLMFVMGGALVTTFVGYRFVLSRPAPVLDTQFRIPTSKRIDLRLIGGSVIFGIGWGISGFCPGGAIPALGTFRIEVIVFIAGLLIGLIAARLILQLYAPLPRTPVTPPAKPK